MTFNIREIAADHLEDLPPRCWRQTSVTLLIGLALFSCIYAATILDIVNEWSVTSYFRVCWFVLPVMVFLLWYERHKLLLLTPQVFWPGIPLVLMSSLIWLFGEWVNIAVLRQLALLSCLYSMVLSLVGWQVFRRLLPYLLLLVFAIPIWTVFLPALKTIVIELVRGYAFLVQFPVEINGFALTIGDKKYIVINQCSGLQFIMLGMLTGWVYGVLIYNKLYKITLLSLLGGSIAVLANGLRIVGIITSNYLFETDAEIEHVLYELPALIPCFGLLFYIFYRLSPDQPISAEQTEPAQKHFFPTGKAVLAVILLALSLTPPLLIHLQQRPIAKNQSIITLQDHVAGWEKSQEKPLWEPVVRYGEVADLAAIYTKNGKRMIVYHAVPLNNETKISGEAVSLLAEGQPNKTNTTFDLCNADACVGRYVYTTFLSKNNSKGFGHIYYSYRAGEQFTGSVLLLRLLRGVGSQWNEQYADVSLVVLVTDSEEPLTDYELFEFMTRSLLK